MQWLEQAGARVAPVRYDLPFEDIKSLWEGLNGLF